MNYILVFIILLILIYFLTSTYENYDNDRIVTGTVYADPNNTYGLGWI